MDWEHLGEDFSGARSALQEKGFLFLPGASLRGMNEGFDKIGRNWPDLPADPYYTGSFPTRFRRHAQMNLNADAGTIGWRPAAGYFQPLEYNPLFGGIVRHFAPIEKTDENESVLTVLIELAAGTIFGLTGQWLVNVHFVRTVSEADRSEAPAPEGPHRDGYDFISLHLVGRNNESGGETIIFDPKGRRVHTLMLDASWDTLYMDDRRFRHDVTPIGASGRKCYRDMILMSYERLPSTPRTGLAEPSDVIDNHQSGGW